MSAALLLRQISLKEGFSLKPEVIVHSDNGGPMKGATMAATMDKLGITPSFSRPSVSNDNAYSESIFKTLKYRPSYPNQAFESLDAARKWVSKFVAWYNREHRHSSIKYVTPEQRHRGDDVVLLERRHERYQTEREVHPERWTGNTRDSGLVSSIQRGVKSRRKEGDRYGCLNSHNRDIFVDTSARVDSLKKLYSSFTMNSHLTCNTSKE